MTTTRSPRQQGLARTLGLLVLVLGGVASEELKDIGNRVTVHQWLIQNDCSLVANNYQFNQVAALQIGGDQFYAGRLLRRESTGEITTEAREMGDVQVTRTWAIPQAGLARCIDEFTNRGSRKQSVRVSWYIADRQSDMVATAIGLSNQGWVDGSSELLKPGNVGVKLAGSQGRLTLICANPSARTQPTVRRQSNYLFIDWQLEIEPGQSEALALVVLGDRATPADEELVQACASHRVPEALAIPAAWRYRLWNLPQGLPAAARSHEQTIDLAQHAIADFRQRHGVAADVGADLVQLAGTGRLTGRLGVSGDLVLARPGEERRFPADTLVAVEGLRGGRIAVIDRQGQRWVGSVVGAPTWTLVSGSAGTVTIALGGLESGGIVARREGVARASGGGFVATVDGEYLRIEGFAGTALRLATPWGELLLAPTGLSRVERLEEPYPHLRLELADGSLLPAFAAAQQLEALLIDGGRAPVGSGEISALQLPGGGLPWIQIGPDLPTTPDLTGNCPELAVEQATFKQVLDRFNVASGLAITMEPALAIYHGVPCRLTIPAGPLGQQLQALQEQSGFVLEGSGKGLILREPADYRPPVGPEDLIRLRNGDWRLHGRLSRPLPLRVAGDAPPGDVHTSMTLTEEGIWIEQLADGQHRVLEWTDESVVLIHGERELVVPVGQIQALELRGVK